jgi:hypothetical protein
MKKRKHVGVRMMYLWVFLMLGGFATRALAGATYHWNWSESPNWGSWTWQPY